MPRFAPCRKRPARGNVALAPAHLLAVALLAGAAGEPPAATRGASGDLGAIDAVALGISPITPDGASCGLDPAQLLQVARQALDSAGVRMEAAAASRLTLSAVTERDAEAETCATATMAGVYRAESFFSAEAGWLERGYVVLWQRSLVRMTPAAAHPAAVAASVRRVVGQFLLDRANQRRAESRPEAATGAVAASAPAATATP